MRLSDVGSEGRSRLKRRCRTIKKAWPFRLLNILRRVFRGHENGTARILCLILKGRPLPDSTRQKIGKIISRTLMVVFCRLVGPSVMSVCQEREVTLPVLLYFY